ncbi:MAG: hypothetical protein ACRBF0_24475 [Calditrichia bacterium]
MNRVFFPGRLCSALFKVFIIVTLLSTSGWTQETRADTTHKWITFSTGKGFAKSNKGLFNLNMDFSWGKRILFYRVGVDHYSNNRPGVVPWLTTISLGVGFAKIEKENYLQFIYIGPSFNVFGVNRTNFSAGRTFDNTPEHLQSVGLNAGMQFLTNPNNNFGWVFEPYFRLNSAKKDAAFYQRIVGLRIGIFFAGYPPKE